MKVEVDMDKVRELVRKAERGLKRTSNELYKAAERGGRNARAKHEYENRTGDLERSTFAVTLASGTDKGVVELAARTYYAKYVAAKGYLSLERPKQIAIDAFNAWIAKFTNGL